MARQLLSNTSKYEKCGGGVTLFKGGQNLGVPLPSVCLGTYFS